LKHVNRNPQHAQTLTRLGRDHLLRSPAMTGLAV
jgi:hypothetical protein